MLCHYLLKPVDLLAVKKLVLSTVQLHALDVLGDALDAREAVLDIVLVVRTCVVILAFMHVHVIAQEAAEKDVRVVHGDEIQS